MYRGERFNGITHLSGALLALAGAVALIVLGSLKADPWRIVSFSIYGATLFFLYLSSTLYHSTRGRAKARVPQVRPRGDLPPHRGHLHALRAGHA